MNSRSMKHVIHEQLPDDESRIRTIEDSELVA
jgi:hypothetical protein